MHLAGTVLRSFQVSMPRAAYTNKHGQVHLYFSPISDCWPARFTTILALQITHILVDVAS